MKIWRKNYNMNIFEKSLTAVHLKNWSNCFGWKSPSSTLPLEIISTQTFQTLNKITCLIIIYNHFSILAPYNIIYNTDLFCLSLIIKMESLSQNKIKKIKKEEEMSVCAKGNKFIPNSINVWKHFTFQSYWCHYCEMHLKVFRCTLVL